MVDIQVLGDLWLLGELTTHTIISKAMLALKGTQITGVLRSFEKARK